MMLVLGDNVRAAPNSRSAEDKYLEHPSVAVDSLIPRPGGTSVIGKRL
jgi:hypothetical protein